MGNFIPCCCVPSTPNEMFSHPVVNYDGDVSWGVLGGVVAERETNVLGG